MPRGVRLRSPNNLKALISAKGTSFIKLSKDAASVDTLQRIANADVVPGPELRRDIAKALDVTEEDIWPDIADIRKFEAEYYKTTP